MNTRRQFLVVSSAAVAALGFVPLAIAGLIEPRGRRRCSLKELSYAALSEQVNTLFHVRLSPSKVIKVLLIKAPIALSTPTIAGRRPAGDAGNEKFSLIFSGPMDTVLDSAIHRFEHGALGEFDMYIGRIGSAVNGEVRYEAAFNRPPPVTIRI